MAKKFYLVGYDIASDKRRAKVAKIMEGFGYRVQFSLFECCLNGNDLGEMMRKVAPSIVIAEGDSILIYLLCQSCADHIFRGGAAPDPWSRAERIL